MKGCPKLSVAAQAGLYKTKSTRSWEPVKVVPWDLL